MLNTYSYKDLLTATLCEKEGSYAIEEIFKRFSSPYELLQASEQELMEIKGMGRVRSRQLLASLQLARLLNTPKDAPTIIRSPQDCYDVLRADMEHLQHEVFKVIFLNTKNHILAVETLSQGSLNASIVHPMIVFRQACKKSAASIICAHNHPTGSTDCSPEDLEITKRLVDCGNLMGIEVLDHIIIGHHRYLSMRESGHM